MSLLKDDLHLHLYGCLTAAEVWELGRDVWQGKSEGLAWYEEEFEKAWGRRPDSASYWLDKQSGLEKLEKDFTFTGSHPFHRFQACFNLVIALFKVRPAEHPVLEFVLDKQTKLGLRHCEYRTIVPGWFSDKDLHQYFERQCQVITEFNQSHSGQTSASLAYSLPRRAELYQPQYRKLKAWIDANQTLARVITAIDFCFAEEGHPPSEKKSFFQQVKQDNRANPDNALAILYHVGESFADLSLESAARWVWQAHSLGADRLGHCLALGIDPAWRLSQGPVRESCESRLEHLAWKRDNASWLKERGYDPDPSDLARERENLDRILNQGILPNEGVEVNESENREDTFLFQQALIKDLQCSNAIIESCPTSNLRIGMIDQPSHHPLGRFVDAGLNCLIASDDPGIFATSLRKEEEICTSLLGIDDKAMTEMAEKMISYRSEYLAGRPNLVAY